MKIDRHNYEEFFLLYVDNELNPAERKMVEAFVMENPDLEEELTMLKQSQLKPDASLVLEDKSVLFKSEKDQLINLQNYESFFLLYVDEELTVEERRMVESFASQYPALQEELGLLMKTRVSADTEIVFPDKQLLYREVGSGKVVAFKVWRMVAVAAMLLIAVGIFWLNPGTGPSNQVAGGNQQTKEEETQIAKKSNEEEKTQSQSNLVAQSANQNEESQQKEVIQIDKKKSNSYIAKLAQPGPNPEGKEGNDQPEKEISGRLLASVDPLGEKMQVQGSTAVSDNTLIVDESFAQAQPEKNLVLTGSDGISDDLDNQSKNRFRGIFRQVTRVVEKNTQIPGGENKKLRIGNIQIALK